MGTGFVVTYSDGSERVFDGTSPIVLQVVDPGTGKTISQILCTVKVTPTWTGAKSSSLVTGTVTIKNSGVIKYTESPANPTLASGVQTQVWSRTIGNSELNTWAPPPGSYTLLVSASITVKITFADGSTSSKTSTGSGQVVYSSIGGG